MKIVLRENIRGLGKRGDIIKVKDGYARNYLIPNQLGWPATKENLKKLDQEKRQYVQRMAEFREQREELAQKLQNVELEIPTKVSAEGKLYGAIHEKQILEALQKADIYLEDDSIILEEPIKKIGYFPFKVHLHPDLEPVDLNIWITNSDTPDGEARKQEAMPPEEEEEEEEEKESLYEEMD